MRSEVIDLRKQRDALVETNSQLERKPAGCWSLQGHPSAS